MTEKLWWIRVWFTKDWWAYLLAPKADDIAWFEVIQCRMKGHPHPVVWYNPNGNEPDMTCTGCGDDLS